MYLKSFEILNKKLFRSLSCQNMYGHLNWLMQNAHKVNLEKIVCSIAATTALFRENVTGYQDTVQVDVSLDGNQLSVIKVRICNYLLNFYQQFQFQNPCNSLFSSNNWSLLTECDGNMFGKHCKEFCGKCVNDGQCHHINGSCLYGCDPGYYGIDCTEGTHTWSQQVYFVITL